MADWFLLEPDHIVVRSLDIGNVRIISHILGQSVALDHYNRKVGGGRGLALLKGRCGF
jgi:hypothetical protein